jgi:ABC-type lipoprotein export system ATPase subunit
VTDDTPAVALRGVRKAFPLAGGQRLEVLDVVDVSLAPGSWTALTGRSGSGKTTLLNLIAGISRPTAGAITVAGADLGAMSEARRDAFRARHVGYVFQTFNLLSAFSAVENVMLPMMFTDAIPRREHRRHAVAILSRLGLGARLSHPPHRLSRGEQQRVAIARALANDPPLILADEPCASLDAHTAREVLSEFWAVCRQDGKTVLVASHEDAALAAAHRVLDMSEINRADGRPRTAEPVRSA